MAAGTPVVAVALATARPRGVAALMALVGIYGPLSMPSKPTRAT
jgi:hypothetical protein